MTCMRFPRAFLPLFVTALIALSSCTTTHDSESPHAQVHWGYASTTGPTAWCDLDAANSACCQGHEQSPIDIKSASATPGTLASLALSYAPGSFQVINNGHTVQATPVADRARRGLMLGATSYALQQFHVHAPSEHAIDGHHAPIELHFVHKSEAGNLAVVGVMVEPGEANAELEKIWHLAPAQEGEGGTAQAVDVDNMLPAMHANFRYAGSLTTPPCSEHVQWIVMQTPITMSEAQIKKLTSMFGGTRFPDGNARPVQPIGARTVEIDPGE
jgi:carbonic anhydrase